MSRSNQHTELREAIARQQAENNELRAEVELLTASRREIMKIDEEHVAEVERLTAMVNDCPVCRQLNTRFENTHEDETW